MWLKKASVTLITSYPKLVLFSLLSVTFLFCFTMLPQIEEKGMGSLLGEDHIVNVKLKALREDYTGKPEASIYIRLVSDDSILKSESLDRLKKVTLALENMQILTDEDIAQLGEFASSVSDQPKQRIRQLISNGLDHTSWEELQEIQQLLQKHGEWTEKSARLFSTIIQRLNPVSEVRSIANVDNIRSDGHGGLDVSPFYDDVPQTKRELEQLESEVSANDLVADTLYNKHYFGISVYSDIPRKDNISLSLLYEEVKRILEQEVPGDESVYMVGSPIVEHYLLNGSQTMGKLMLLLIAFVVFVLWIFLRWIWGMFLPILDSILTIMFTMALLPVFGVGLDSITSGIPIFLLSTGVADGIHMIAVYREFLVEGLERKDAVKATINKMFIPVTLTSFTTAIGFCALGFSDMVQFKHLGLFVAAGAIVALIYSIYLIPALLMVLPVKNNNRASRATRFDALVTQSLRNITYYAITKPKNVLVATLVVTVVCVYGLLNLNVENDSLRSFFEEDTELVRSSDEISKTTGDSDLYVKLMLTGNETFKRAENLQYLEGLQKFIEQKSVVGNTFSLVDLIKRINYVMHEFDPAYERLPESQEQELARDNRPANAADSDDAAPLTVSGDELISQYIFLYENQGGDQLSDIIDTQYQDAVISVLLKSTLSSDALDLLTDIENYRVEHLPARFKIDFVGGTYENAVTYTSMIGSALMGLTMSVIFVTVIMCLIYRSILKGAVGMIPLVFTVVVHFGLMGLFGVNVDWGTSMVAALIIGIGVDYSIHYLSALFRELDPAVSYGDAMLGNVNKVGKPILANALTVGPAFLVLVLGDVVPLAKLGITMSITLLMSAVASLIILPALISWLDQFDFFRRKQTVNVGTESAEGA